MTTVSRLEQIVGPNRLLTQREDLVPYSFDATPILNQLPQAVVFTKTVDEVIAVLKLANEIKTPIVTRGSGTGLSGGSVPVPGCVVLCTVQMDQILKLDPPNLTMLVEPGVLTQQVALSAESAGLFYPPDPGSMKISTIGGNIAEDSGGLRGLKYGVTRDYAMALEVVLPTGELLRTGSPCVKDAAGYSLKDLFIGSEGTLGVITKILLKLIPKPAARRTILATYDRITDAALTVSAIIAAKIIPCTLEFLDQITIRCVEDYAKIGLPTDVGATLASAENAVRLALAKRAASSAVCATNTERAP